MKRLVAALTFCSLLTAAVNTASAHDRGWSTTGKILTGLVAGYAIARAVEPAPVYYTPAYYEAPPVYAAPAPVYVPARRVYYAPAPVYVTPPPVYVRSVYPAPVYYHPRPSFSFSFGFGCYPRYYRHCW